MKKTPMLLALLILLSYIIYTLGAYCISGSLAARELNDNWISSNKITTLKTSVVIPLFSLYMVCEKETWSIKVTFFSRRKYNVDEIKFSVNAIPDDNTCIISMINEIIDMVPTNHIEATNPFSLRIGFDDDSLIHVDNMPNGYSKKLRALCVFILDLAVEGGRVSHAEMKDLIDSMP